MNKLKKLLDLNSRVLERVEAEKVKGGESCPCDLGCACQPRNEWAGLKLACEIYGTTGTE